MVLTFAVAELTRANSFAPKTGKFTPSELKFTFDMNDKSPGVNPKDRVKRQAPIGTCHFFWFVSSKQFYVFGFFLSTHFYFIGMQGLSRRAWMAFTNSLFQSILKF